jgi:hypothetical protein
MCLALPLLLLACADKTPEEHRQEKEDAEWARMQRYQGVYRGSLEVQGETMPMEVVLTPQKTPINSSDITNAIQISLRANIVIPGQERSEAAIQSAKLGTESELGTASFSGLVNVTSTVGNSTTTLSVNGSIANYQQFEGTINLLNRSGSTGFFRVAKDAFFSQPIVDPSRPAPSSGEAFAGAFELPCTGGPIPCNGRNSLRIQVRLVITKVAPTSSETFLNRFVQQKAVNVSLEFDGDSPYQLPEGTLDTVAGTLVADRPASGGSAKLQINCRRQATGDVPGWNCNYFSSARGGVRYSFQVVAEQRRAQ